ncbi:Glutamate racemase [hydrothermal vent metagenome]|uniref:glutamate racemase n=1 Tax=hydrothermal vent metagenome TaxID=652676 RepID=A0A3B1DYS6_9ZZZZ
MKNNQSGNYERTRQNVFAENPVGIFDSGIGGLTVLREILNLMPRENMIYLGDTARVPYGIRSSETVTKYAMENTEFLLGKKIKLIVVACNTVSAISLDILKKKTEVPVIGVLLPGAEAAIRSTRNKRIGVIGTETTIHSSAYHRALTSLDPDVEVIGVPCPLFVPLVEEGWTDGEVTRKVAAGYLAGLKESNIDTLVLGCTHYPLLKGIINDVMGDGITLIDSAVETARIIGDILKGEGLLRRNNASPERKFFVTDTPDRFRKVGERFLGHKIEYIERVEIPGTKQTIHR